MNFLGKFEEFHPRRRRQTELTVVVAGDVLPRGKSEGEIEAIAMLCCDLYKTHHSRSRCPYIPLPALGDDPLDVCPAAAGISCPEATFLIVRRTRNHALRRGRTNLSLHRFYFEINAPFSKQGNYSLGL
jgi:hypothetical protein